MVMVMVRRFFGADHLILVIFFIFNDSTLKTVAKYWFLLIINISKLHQNELNFSAWKFILKHV